jgi:hypothetical protein
MEDTLNGLTIGDWCMAARDEGEKLEREFERNPVATGEMCS